LIGKEKSHPKKLLPWDHFFLTPPPSPLSLRRKKKGKEKSHPLQLFAYSLPPLTKQAPGPVEYIPLEKEAQEEPK
jgi:hypothetical protein